MAQIVTITNPLTGQPAQVDQLEHTAQEIDDGIGFESTDYPGCYYRTVDGAVEWFNPPMLLGDEYRTTERYQGKPVYVSLIDCGNMPSAGGSKTVQAPYDGTDNPITNAWIVHSHLSYYNQTLPMYGYGNTVTVKAAAGVSSSGLITIYASEDTDLTNSSAILYVVLKYTKSTD